METTFDPQPGRGGLPFVHLAAADGATADVYLHGAHATAWTPAGGSDSRLFLSDRAAFAPGGAIRGGVPVIFPQFADTGPYVRHGFARTAAWALVRAGRTPDGAAFAVLALADTDETRALWPFPFGLRYTVRVAGASLEMRLDVQNPGPAPFDFTAALHAYLAADLPAQVAGLHGLAYRDKVAGGTLRIETDAVVTAEGQEIDRVYLAVPTPLALSDAHRTLRIEQTGFADAVVWNPGREKAAGMSDLAPGDAGRFVCVEAAQVARPVVLAPGQAWTGTQRLTLA